MILQEESHTIALLSIQIEKYENSLFGKNMGLLAFKMLDFVNKKIAKSVEKSPKWRQITMSGNTALLWNILYFKYQVSYLIKIAIQKRCPVLQAVVTLNWLLGYFYKLWEILTPPINFKSNFFKFCFNVDTADNVKILSNRIGALASGVEGAECQVSGQAYTHDQSIPSGDSCKLCECQHGQVC